MNHQEEFLNKTMSSETHEQLEEDSYKPLNTSPKDSLYERGFKDGYNQALKLLL
jgi:hypothetical protein